MSTWIRRDDALWRDLVDGVALLAAGSKEPFALSATGAVLWDLLAEPLTVEDAAARLAGVYGVAAEHVADDIRPLLRELQARAVVRCLP